MALIPTSTDRLKAMSNLERDTDSVEHLFTVYFFAAACATAFRWLGHWWTGEESAPLFMDGLLTLWLVVFSVKSNRVQHIGRLKDVYLLCTQVWIAVLWFFFTPIYTLLPPIVLLFISVYSLYINRGAYFWGTAVSSLVVVVVALSMQWINRTQVFRLHLSPVTWQYYTFLTLYIGVGVVVLLSYVQYRIVRERRKALLQTTALEQARREAEQKSDLFAQLRTLQSDFFLEEDLQPRFDRLLRQLLDMTKSQFGLLAEVQVDDQNQLLESKIHASVYNVVFEQLSFEEQQRYLSENFQRMVEQGRSRVNNSPDTSCDNAYMFKITNYLSLPVMYNYKVVGYVLVMNREGGYQPSIIEELAPFLSTYGSVLQNIHLKRAQREYENQLRKAKELAEQNDRLKSQFITNISHELRTPLSLIIGPLTVLKQMPFDELTPQVWAQHLNTMERNSKKMRVYLKDMLDLAKLDKQELSAQREEALLYQLVKEAYEAFETEHEQRKLVYEFHYTLSQQLRIKTDVEKLQKVLHHLLSNAFKYTKDGGEITITVVQVDASVEIRICDTGIGVAKEHHEKIFHRFYQIEQPNETIFSGTGVGLALCLELAAVLEVDLQVESVVGAGSCFSVVIPQEQLLDPIEADALPTKITKGQTSVESKPKRPCLLVAEDNRDMRLFLEQILCVHYDVVLVENGRKAWTTLQRNPERFDLLITDLMMPEMDGYALLENIHAQPWAMRLPIVVLTAKAQFDARLGTLRIGMDDYLTKPFEVSELLATVHYLLGNRVFK